MIKYKQKNYTQQETKKIKDYLTHKNYIILASIFFLLMISQKSKASFYTKKNRFIFSSLICINFCPSIEKKPTGKLSRRENQTRKSVEKNDVKTLNNYFLKHKEKKNKAHIDQNQPKKSFFQDKKGPKDSIF